MSEYLHAGVGGECNCASCALAAELAQLRARIRELEERNKKLERVAKAAHRVIYCPPELESYHQYRDAVTALTRLPEEPKETTI